MFFCSFTKGNNFCDFLFASQYKEDHQSRTSLRREAKKKVEDLISLITEN